MKTKLYILSLLSFAILGCTKQEEMPFVEDQSSDVMLGRAQVETGEVF